MLRQPVIKTLLLGLLVWSVVSSLVNALGTTILILILMLLAAGALVGWVATCHPRVLTPLHHIPGCRSMIPAMLRLIGRPHSLAAADYNAENMLLVRTSNDFDLLADDLEKSIVGHKGAIHQITELLAKQVLLRDRERNEQHRTPLATFLLTGPEGCGKSTLAARIGLRLYRGGAVSIVDCRKYDDTPTTLDQLFGSDSAAGLLQELILRRPYHTLIFENLATSSVQMQERLAELYASGYLASHPSRKRISFQHCIFFNCLHCTGRRVDAGTIHSAKDGTTDYLAGVPSLLELEPAFLQTIDQVVQFAHLSPFEKAQLVLSLTAEECRRYNVALDAIDPEIVAGLVHSIDSQGSGAIRSRIRAVIRDDLIRAVKTAKNRVSIVKPIHQEHSHGRFH